MSGAVPFPRMHVWKPPFQGLFSSLGPVLSHPFIWDSARLFLFGSIIETGRRMLRWILRRFRLQLFTKAQFQSGNPAYQWLISFLTQESVSGESRDFDVEAKTSRRKWKEPTDADNEHVDYIPVYGSPQLVRWNGYWLDYEVTLGQNGFSTLHLNLYTRDKSVLFALVEECRLKYIEISKPYVTIYSTDADRYNDRYWDSVKNKRRRPLDSLVLDEGVMESLLVDARDFLAKEDWYINAGIPHRRGYLLHGPPGTGKTTTVYAMAAELDIDIFTLSLASSNIDDRYLTRAVSFLPPRAILLIEDIDCAFPPRDEEDDELDPEVIHTKGGRTYDPRTRSQVTLSGLLNVLDGVGSEEGKIFFATTNYIEHLDPALLRPGRIDRKIEYKLSSRKQANALFKRFFPVEKFSGPSKVKAGEDSEAKDMPNISELADDFAQEVPENEFSTAELQGYLLEWKQDPVQAVRGVQQWVAHERELKRAQEARERLRRERIEAARVQGKLEANEAMIVGIGQAFARGQAQGPHYRRRRRHSDSTPTSSGEEDGMFEEGSNSREELRDASPTASSTASPTPSPIPPNQLLQDSPPCHTETES